MILVTSKVPKDLFSDTYDILNDKYKTLDEAQKDIKLHITEEDCGYLDVEITDDKGKSYSLEILLKEM